MSAFGITPASTTVPLDESRRGTASFTVSNETGHAVRVRVTAVGAGVPAADRAWLVGPEHPERPLSVDASDQFSVRIEVPAEVEGGAYHFRLDAVSVDLPDEEWAHGPVVVFLVPVRPTIPEPLLEPTPAPEPPRGYLATAVGALLGGIAGGGAAALIGLLLALVGGFSDESESGAGDPAETIFTAAFAAFGAALVLLLLTLLLMAIGLWVGSVVGSYVSLRLRDHDNAGTTAITLALVFPFWGLLVFASLASVGGDIPDLVALLLLASTVPVITVPAGLAARAIHRFRTTGGL